MNNIIERVRLKTNLKTTVNGKTTVIGGGTIFKAPFPEFIISEIGECKKDPRRQTIEVLPPEIIMPKENAKPEKHEVFKELDFFKDWERQTAKNYKPYVMENIGKFLKCSEEIMLKAKAKWEKFYPLEEWNPQAWLGIKSSEVGTDEKREENTDNENLENREIVNSGNNTGSNVCIICNQSFDSKEDFEQHITEAHVNNKI